MRWRVPRVRGKQQPLPPVAVVLVDSDPGTFVLWLRCEVAYWERVAERPGLTQQQQQERRDLARQLRDLLDRITRDTS